MRLGATQVHCAPVSSKARKLGGGSGSPPSPMGAAATSSSTWSSIIGVVKVGTWLEEGGGEYAEVYGFLADFLQ